MHSEIVLTVDPQGREVHLGANLLKAQEPGFTVTKLTDMLQTALEAPSCMIVMPEGDRYYFRSLDQHFTVLLHVVYREEKWQAVEWVKNPDPAYIQELLKGGTFITGSNLG